MKTGDVASTVASRDTVTGQHASTGFLPVAVGSVSGLALGLAAFSPRAPGPVPWIAAAIGAALLLWGAVRRPRLGSSAVRGRLRLRIAALFLLGLWRGAITPEPDPPEMPSFVSIRGTVEVPPVAVTESRDGRFRRVTIFSIATSRGTSIRVRCDGEAPFLRGGHGIEARGKLLPPRPRRNPGDAASSDAWILSVRHPGHLRRIPLPEGQPMTAILGTIREEVYTVVKSLYRGNARGLVLSMVLGDRRLLSDEVSDSLRYTGTVHLLAISGLHVGIVMFVLLRIPFPRRWAVPAQLSLLGGFCLLTGAHPPVLRASIAFGLHRLFQATGRNPAPLSTLGLTALILLGGSPGLLHDVGFQLSFVAVLSILTWGVRICARLPRRPLLAACLISLSTGIATAPLTALYFQRVYPLGPLWNLMALPLSAVALVGGLLTVLVGSVSLGLAAPLAWVVERTLHVLLDVLAAASWVPGSTLVLPPPSPLAVGAAFAVLLLGLCPRGRVTWILAGSLLVGICLASLAMPRVPELVILDVGDGDACVLSVPGWGHALLDAGSTGTDARAGPNLQRRVIACGARSLSAVFLGHFHDDHVRGFRGMVRRLSVGWLGASPFGFRSPLGRRLSTKAREVGIPIAEMARGTTVLLEGDSTVEIQILHPARGETLLAPERENDLSLAYLLRVGPWTMLFLGDLEERGLARLLSTSESLRAQVVLAPHHGRRNRLWPELLERARPEAVVFSGAGASAAHELVGALERRGIRVLATWRRGAIRLRCFPEAGWQLDYWNGSP